MLKFGYPVARNNELFEGKNGFPQIQTPVYERTVVDSGLLYLPALEILLFGCFKTRTSR